MNSNVYTIYHWAPATFRKYTKMCNRDSHNPLPGTTPSAVCLCFLSLLLIINLLAEVGECSPYVRPWPLLINFATTWKFNYPYAAYAVENMPFTVLYFITKLSIFHLREKLYHSEYFTISDMLTRRPCIRGRIHIFYIFGSIFV